MPAPSYLVQVGWNAPGVVSSPGFDSRPTTAYDDISAEVRKITIKRGRRDNDRFLEAGEATIELNDTTGKYVPGNNSSPIAAYLLPHRPVRVQATYNAVTYTLFYGFIRRVSPDPKNNRATIYCYDLFGLWNLSEPTAAPSYGLLQANISTTAAISNLVESVGPWGFNVLKDYSTGSGTQIDFLIDSNTKSVTAGLVKLMETDRGTIFVRGDGYLVYLTREAVNKPPRNAAQSTLSGVVSLSVPDLDVDNVRNRASFTRAGGLEQTASDSASGTAYGYRDFTRVTGGYWRTDTETLGAAQWAVSERSTPLPANRAVMLINTDNTTLTAQLAREVGDHVSVTLPSTTITEYDILGLQHVVSNGGLLLETTWVLRNRAEPVLPLTFDYGRIGNRLGY